MKRLSVHRIFMAYIWIASDTLIALARHGWHGGHTNTTLTIAFTVCAALNALAYALDPYAHGDNHWLPVTRTGL